MSEQMNENKNNPKRASRSGEPAIPPARQDSACQSQDSFSPSPEPADQILCRCSKTASRSRIRYHSSKCSDGIRNQKCRWCRPNHPDWGCTLQYAAIVMVALAAASEVPSTHGYLQKYATWCGDGVCEPRLENRGWCPQDCWCGDLVCDDSEALSASCPQDCLSRVDILTQTSRVSQAGIAFSQQPVVRIFDITQHEAYTPGIVTATLYQVVDDITGTIKLNVPVEGGLNGRQETPWSCGFAKFTDLTVQRAGIYTLQFFSVIKNVNFLIESSNFTIVRGSKHHLAMSLQPAGFRPNFAFKTQPVVLLLDVAENILTGDGPESSMYITASLTQDSPKVYLAPTNRIVKQAQNGMAKFRDLYLPPHAIGKEVKLLFSADIYLLPCESHMFVVAEVAHRLVVTNAPTFSEVVEPFPRQPKVEVQDQFGNLCTWYEDTGVQNEDGVSTEGIVVVAALQPPPDVAAAMLGEKSKLVVDGRVAFTDLNIDKPGIGFTILFLVTRGVVNPETVRTFTIEPFNVSYGYPYRLVFDFKPGSDTEIQDPRGATPGEILAQQPRIMVQDRVGNVVGNERGILEITAKLLQSGRPAEYPLKGFSVMKSCLHKNEITGLCECMKGKSTGCGVAQWPVTMNGIRIDMVGKNYSLIFEATFREEYTEIEDQTNLARTKIREIILIPVESLVFEVNYGVVNSIQVAKQPWGFVLNEVFLGQPVVAVYDKAGNFVPTSEVELQSHFVVVDEVDGSSRCCFDLSFKTFTTLGYAYFKGMKLAKIPSQGNILKIRFSSLLVKDYVETDSFIMANTPVKIEVIEQPVLHYPGIGFLVEPKVALLDANNTIAGWYKDAPMNVTATICVEIPCLTGKFVGSLSTGKPCFKCTTDTSNFCQEQTQTPVLLKPRKIPTERELIRGDMNSVAFNGVSTFTNLVIDKIGTYKLKFTSVGYPSVESNAFTIFHGVADHLYLQAQPMGAHAGSPLSQQPVVVIRDAGKNIVTSDLKTVITASLLNSRNIVGATLKTANDNIMGPFVRVTQGTLYWQRLQIDVAGTYEILFNSSLGADCTPVKSESFEILRSPPVKLAVVKSPDICLRGKPCEVQPVVEVQDLQGNKVLITHGFNTSISARSCLWTSQFDERKVVQGSVEMDGVGVFGDSVWHAGCNGKYQLTVTAAGLQTAHSEIFLVSDPATNTTAIVSPTPGLAGKAFRQQPQVHLTDREGRRVRGTSATVTASLLKCDNGGPCKVFTAAPIIGAVAENTSLGQAQFTNMRLDMAGTCYRFLFTSSGMVAGQSRLFDVTVGTIVNVLQIIRQPVPTGSIAGKPFSSQPVIIALDAGKNIMVFQNSLQITASLLIGAEISRDGLQGDRTSVVENGVGTFTDLFTLIRGDCFRLEFEVYGKSALSDRFYVGPSSPAKLYLASQPSGLHVGWRFDVQPVLYFQDQFNNVMNHADCTIDCELLNSTLNATLLSNSVLDVEDVLQGTNMIGFDIDPTFGTRASFSDLRIDRAGTYRLHFTTGSDRVSSVISDDITVMPAEDRANHLNVLVQPYGVRSTAPMNVQPVVAIQDLGNNLIKSADTNITARLLGGYTCGTLQYPDKFKCGPWVTDHKECGSSSNCQRTPAMELFGTKTVETKNGVATFTDLWIKGQPTRFVQLEFTSGPRCTPKDSPCDAVKSYVFDVAGAVTYLSLMRNPSVSAVAGEPLVIQPQLGIFDASGRRHTWSPPGQFQAMNVSSFQNVSTWCNSSQTREELAQTGYDCNINRTNTTALNISQYGMWDRIQGNITNIEYLHAYVNFTDLRFDQVARSRSGYHLKFQFRALTGEIFNLDWCCVKVTPAPPNRMEIVRQPSEPSVGHRFRTQAIIRVVDRYGNLATYEFGQIQAKLYQNDEPAPTGSVERVFGSNVALAQKGVVQFTDLGYNQSGANFSIGFIFPGIPLAFTNRFEILPGIKIHYLHISRHPQGFKEGSIFSVQPIIETHDLGGNKISPNVTVPAMIKVTLVNSTSRAPFRGVRDVELLGETLVNASDGSASFKNLAISRSSSSMVLRFELYNSTEITYWSATIWRTVPPRNENETYTQVPNGTLSNISLHLVYVDSSEFEVANNETGIVFSNVLSNTSTGGIPFNSQPIIHLKDDNNFIVSNHERMLVSAELWMYGSTERICPPDRPWRCGLLSDKRTPGSYDTACAINEGACPKLEGTTTQVLKYGVATFDDLFINGCNELGRNGCFQSLYKIRFTTESSRGTIILDTFPVNITVGQPVGAIVNKQPLPGPAGSTFQTQPVVWIVDAGGNRVTDWSLSVTATLIRGIVTTCCDKCICPAWFGSADVSPVNGAFHFNFAINTAGFDYKFMFQSGKYSVESNYFTVKIGDATHLRVIRQPLPGLKLYGGSYFQVQPTLEVLDRGSNVVQNYVGKITAELLPNEFGAKLIGDLTTIVKDGIGSFEKLAIDTEGSCYVIRFSSGSIMGADAVPITVDIGLPSRMKFVREPTGFRPGYAFEVQPVLAIVDEGGNIVPSAQDSIEITLLDQNKNRIEGGLCSFNLMGSPLCQTAVRAVNGVATFSGLRVDRVAKGYTLEFGKAQGGYKTVTSAPFDVNVGPEFQLFVDRELGLSTQRQGQPGYLFPTQPHITILDSGGNLVPISNRRVSGELYRLNQPAVDTGPELWQVQMQMYDPAYKDESIIDNVLSRRSTGGKATYSNLRVDVAAADYIIRFRSENVLSVDSSIFTIDLGAAYSTKIHRQPAGLKSGMPFIVQPIVHVVDRGMNTLHTLNPTGQSYYPMIAAISSGEGVMFPFPAEYGILPIRDGVTTFSTLTITGRGEHLIKFTAFDLHEDVTVVLNVSGEAHAVSIKEQPIGSVASDTMALQPETYIRDSKSVIVDTDSSSQVTVRIVEESNPNSAVISGTLTVGCCWGQCKFTDLVISKSGQRYRLAFSSLGLLTDISRPFEVGGPAKLVVSNEPSSAISEFAMGNQPVISVTDMKSITQTYCQRDHCDIGGPAEVTATIKPGTGGLEFCVIQGNHIAFVADGLATFTNLAIKGAGASFRERKYVLVFTGVDLYSTESAEFTLTYIPRPPTNYLQATVQITRFRVTTFNPKEQTIFVDTIAKYLGTSSSDVAIVSIRDVMIRFRDEIRRAPIDSRIATFPSYSQSQSHNWTSEHPGQGMTPQTLQNKQMSIVVPFTENERKMPAERRREEAGIDIRFRVYSNNTKDLFRMREDLTVLLKREGALAALLNDGGLANIQVIMTEAPEAYTPTGGLLPPLVENDPAGAIAGSLIGAFLLFSCSLGCYTMWFRARKRALIRSENDIDAMNLLYALGIEDPKEEVDAAMPWTAEKMLEGSSEEVLVVEYEKESDA